jgi:L-ascorbate metabolism protein UlaG (beta-lactamase superfamily)
MKNKKFITTYGIKNLPMQKVLKWKLANLLQPKREKCPDDDFRLAVEQISTEDLQTDEDFIIWLGHATFYIQLDGVKILTDPIFGNIPFIPRLSPLPLNAADLQPDVILISHGHYDHLDLKSLEILDIYAKKTKIILPCNLSSYLKDGVNAVELGWYESVREKSIEITALPASHWHRRGLFDFNRALWCSFAIKSKTKTLYFAGDTAFDSHFKEIKEYVGEIDVVLLPIGAYLPREVMQDNHMNPQEALNAAKVLGAKMMIPYHYGTFKLSDEPIGEPYSWITKLSKTSRVKVKVAKVGEIVSFIE